VSGPAPRLLLVEDDPALSRALRTALERVGYAVTAVDDGTDFTRVVASARPDLALVDVALSTGPDGFELARELRANTDASIVFITAADTLEDRLTGFELGADDYIPKPFALAELLARVRAVLRRHGRVVSPVIEVRDLLIDEQQRVVVRGGREIPLTSMEFELLATLAKEPGRVFSKGQLLTLIWGFDQYSPNLVEVHVSALRRKLGPDGTRLIQTERGRGYVLRP
jgi:DNA-binding response OmpR family regulator